MLSYIMRIGVLFMDFIVVFFRDILDGPLYIAIVVINSILICSCIGYLADNYLKRKKAQENYNNTYATVGSNAGVSVGTAQAPQQAQPQAVQQQAAPAAGQPTQTQ